MIVPKLIEPPWKKRFIGVVRLVNGSEALRRWVLVV
jgi:hypothetical protein